MRACGSVRLKTIDFIICLVKLFSSLLKSLKILTWSRLKGVSVFMSSPFSRRITQDCWYEKILGHWTPWRASSCTSRQKEKQNNFLNCACFASKLTRQHWTPEHPANSSSRRVTGCGWAVLLGGGIKATAPCCWQQGFLSVYHFLATRKSFRLLAFSALLRSVK